MSYKRLHTYILIWFIILWWSFSYTNASEFSDSCTANYDEVWVCQNLILWENKVLPYCYSILAWWEWTDNVSTCNFYSTVNSLSSQQETKRNIIQNYCSALLSENQLNWRIYFAKGENTWWNAAWDQTFDSNQSLFIYALCASFLSWDDRPFIPNTYVWDIVNIMTWDISKALRLPQKDGWKDSCSIVDNQNLNSCDLELYSSEIFSAIMSDIFKIKYAEVFQVNNKQLNDDEERIPAFFSWYLHINNSYETLQNKFPQTISVINSNQKYQKNILWTIKLLNNDELITIMEEGWCSSNSDIQWANYIACALHWTHAKNTIIDISFLTLFYNEILNYRLFNSYYAQQIEEYAKRQKNNDPKSYKLLINEFYDLKEHSDLLIKAADQTFTDLQELTFTYPLHIWLLAYQERILSFRNYYLSPIITSFYSLSEKLQNVQEAP